MPDPLLMAKAGVAAAGIAAVLLLFFAWPWRTANSLRRGVGGVLGVGFGFAVGCWMLGLQPHWPPSEDLDRLLLLLLPAVMVAELISSSIGSKFPRLVQALRFAVAGGTTPLLLHRTIYLVDLAGPGSREWSRPRAALILTGMALVAFAAWTSLLRLARRTESRSILLGLSLVCGGTGLTVMLSGYASGGQLAVPLAAALGGIFVASWFLVRPVDTSAVLGVGIVGHFALPIIGHFFGQLTVINAVLLMLAPQVAWLPELSWLRERPLWLRDGLRIVLTVAVMGTAVALAQKKFAEDSSRSAPAADSSPSLDDYMNFGK